jgi:flagellar motor switch protein FliM
LSLCFPASVIETLEAKLTHGGPRSRKQPTATEQARLLANLGRVPLSVTTMLETRLSARDLLALRPGDIISLGQPASAPVEVQVGQINRYTGRLVTSPAGAAVRVEQTSRDLVVGGAQ